VTDFLLEIGVENIPAGYLPPVIAQLQSDAAAMAARSRLVYKNIYTTATPRRLVLLVRGLEDRQAAGEEVATGPPASRAFLEDGRPSPAAEGFARGQGVSVADLVRVETPKGEYLAVRKTLPRGKTVAALKAELPALITGLRFPKTMKWEESGARFARPVRWIVALYGKDVVPVVFAGVKSGRVTWGRPWMRSERRTVRDAASHAATVKEFGTILDAGARRDRIAALAGKAAVAARGRLVPDDDLLTELCFMTEDPRPLVGSFDARYLDLPAPVIVTAMRSHQRYLALTDAKGQLMPRFITFTDGPVKGAPGVARGNERVLRARLEDAEFYWREDVKRGVDTLADELDRIVFIEGFGSVGQRWRRVLELARGINAAVPRSQQSDEAALQRVARLAKADLASTMIRDGKEFTALQGVIGSHYARAAGESDTVCDAVRDHYAPRAAGDALPASTLARVLGLADRIDTIVGSFLAGMKPTGSQDPFALRRGANGAVRLAAELPGVRLDALVEAARAAYATGLPDARVDELWKEKRVGADVIDFVKSRVEAFLKENLVAPDVAEAVLPVSWVEPGVALARAREISRLRGDTRFERLVVGVRRVGNILAKDRRRVGASLEEVALGLTGRDGKPAPYSAEHFQDGAENALSDAVQAALKQITQQEAKQDFTAILASLSGLADPIDRYFEKVLVNSDDPVVKENRHAFLAGVYRLFGHYADFLTLQEQTPAA